MTRAKLPEDTRPDYSAPPTEYRVTLPDGTAFSLTDPDTAEVYSRNGAKVTARRGWE